MTPNDSIQWLKNQCQELVRKYFFEEAEDMVDEIKNVLENYQTSSIEN